MRILNAHGFSQMSESIAKVSGAVLGFITGNRRGAVMGYNAGKNLYQYSQNSMAPIKRKRSSTSMAKTKRRKTSKINKRKRNRKNKRNSSKKRNSKSSIRRMVKNMIHGEDPKGYYHKSWNAVLPDPADNSRVITEVSNQNGVAISGADFRFFNTARMIDAVSVLFNNKADNVDYGITTDNFASPYLKFNVIYQSAKTTITNNSYAIIEFEVYEYKFKDDETKNFREIFTEALAAVDQKGFSSKTITYQDVQPTTLPAFNRKMNVVKTHRFTLYPGQVKKIFIKGRVGHFDMDKLSYSSGPVLYYPYGKNFAHGLCFAYKPSTSAATSSTVLNGGAGTYVGPAGNVDAICVDVEEIFKINAPENADTGEQDDSYCWYHYQPSLGTEGRTIRQISNSLEPLGVNV